MNQHMLTGTVENDPQSFSVGDKTKIAIRLAEAGGKGWHNVVIWSDDGITVPKKGDLVYVEGRVQTRSYGDGDDKRYVTETVARVIQPIGTATAQLPPAESDLFDE